MKNGIFSISQFRVYFDCNFINIGDISGPAPATESSCNSNAKNAIYLGSHHSQSQDMVPNVTIFALTKIVEISTPI